ncbi:MAG: hypothetical protein U1E27_12870, partial [Kiritimatiellia bacterium]|nr:hypothetical protein [Kiritimatiellia bacterium]
MKRSLWFYGALLCPVVWIPALCAQTPAVPMPARERPGVAPTAVPVLFADEVPPEAGVGETGQKAAEPAKPIDEAVAWRERAERAEAQNRELQVEMRAQIERSAGELGALRKTAMNTASSLDAARQSLAALQTVRAEAEAQEAQWRKEWNVLKEAHALAGDEMMRIDAERTALKTRLDNAEAKILELEKQREIGQSNAEKTAELQQQVDHLRGQMLSLQQEKAALEQEKQEWSRTQGEWRDRAAISEEWQRRYRAAELDLQAQIRDRANWMQQMDDLRAQLRKSDSDRTDALRIARQSREELASLLVREREAGEKNLRDVREKLSEAVRDRDRAQNQAGEWQRQVSRLEETARRQSTEAVALQADLTDANRRVRDLMKDLARLVGEAEAAQARVKTRDADLDALKREQAIVAEEHRKAVARADALAEKIRVLEE